MVPICPNYVGNSLLNHDFNTGILFIYGEGMLVGSNPEVRSIAKSGDPTVSDIPHDLGCETLIVQQLHVGSTTSSTGDLTTALHLWESRLSNHPETLPQ